MNAVTLFALTNEDIKIHIEARFDADDLVVEGYDIGLASPKRFAKASRQVEEYWGDSDYEYSVKVQAADVHEVFSALQLPLGDKAKLLHELSQRFNTNTAYSDFRNFLDAHKIKSEGFSWS
ncbi:MAG: hypothetical protein K2U26_11475 [Cyclobacteriaceae bacterium]|nr:hypothetical protein [Cyclobacteriaceae bacterium]